MSDRSESSAVAICTCAWRSETRLLATWASDWMISICADCPTRTRALDCVSESSAIFMFCSATFWPSIAPTRLRYASRTETSVDTMRCCSWMSVISRLRSLVTSETREASVLRPRNNGCEKLTRNPELRWGLKLDSPPVCVDRLPVHVSE